MADPACKPVKAMQFQPVRLPRELDHEGLLVLRDGALLGVFSRLSDIHGELEGRWYPEAVFSDGASWWHHHEGLADTDEIERWLATVDGFEDE